MRLAHLIPVLLLAACGEGDDDTGSDTAADTAADTDTDSDSDTDTDSDSDTDTEPITPHDCLKKHGIARASSTWSYTWKNSSRVGGKSISVVGYDNAANTATLRTRESWNDNGALFDATIDTRYVCDADFLYMVSRTEDSTLTIFGTPEVASNTYTYDSPVKLHPNAPAGGTQWQRVTKGQKTDKDGNVVQLDSSVFCGVMQTDMLGYGDWRPASIECVTSTGPADSYLIQEDVGVVSDTFSRLTTHTP